MFSNNVLGVSGWLIIVISCVNTTGIKGFISAPSLIANSPIAHVALLHTEMYSAFKFWPRMGRNSAVKRREELSAFAKDHAVRHQTASSQNVNSESLIIIDHKDQ